MISAKLSARSFLEGTSAIAVYASPQSQPLIRLRQQIHRPANQFGQASLQCSKCEQPDMGLRVQLTTRSTSAIGHGFATGNGAIL